MKTVLSFLLALAIGAGTRVLGVPLPAPPALVGALLVLAMTLGHLPADKRIARRAGNGVGDEGLSDDPARPMQADSIEYDANYQLLHDNLCDLSHVDYVHARTLRPATGAYWAETAPSIVSQDRAIRFERWFVNADQPGGEPGAKVDTWSAYDFAGRGIFIMRGSRYPAGTAGQCNMEEPVGIEPLMRNIEQQAVTPIDEKRTAYHYATGLIGNTPELTQILATRMGVVMETFAEDRTMIEAQQKIWDRTDPAIEKHFLPQDKGPFLMRKLMDRLIHEENSQAQEAS